MCARGQKGGSGPRDGRKAAGTVAGSAGACVAARTDREQRLGRTWTENLRIRAALGGKVRAEGSPGTGLPRLATGRHF